MDYKYSFNSYSEVIRAVSQQPAFDGNRCEWKNLSEGDTNSPYMRERSAGFYGWKKGEIRPIAKLGEFFLHGGWPQGVKKMREVIEQVKAPVVQSVRRRQAWGADGSELSRDRLYSGNIDTMYRTTRKAMTVAPTRIRVVFDSCVSSLVKADDMFWAGAAGTVLTESLVEAGYQVELVATAKSAQGSDTFQTDVVFKGFDQPFNLDATLAITAHASFFRQVWFCAMSTLMPRQEFYGKGSVSRVDAKDFETPGVTTLVITPMRSASEANAWVKNALRKLEGND